MYITIDGPDQSGKSSQLATIERVMKKFGCEEIIRTKEPGGNPVADAIRNMMLFDERFEGASTMVEMMCMMASRYSSHETVIKQAMRDFKAKGLNDERFGIIGDRSNLSTYSYQCGRCVDADKMFELLNNYDYIQKQDIAIILDVDADEAYRRRVNMGVALDNFEKRRKDYHHKVSAQFAKFAKENPFDIPKVIYLESQETLEQTTVLLEELLSQAIVSLYNLNEPVC